MNTRQLQLLDLPEEIIETVLSYLTYHEASECRMVCKLFNKHCQQRLNKGFAIVDKLHSRIQKDVKNRLPRRESERRNHPLARHVDILSAIETRLSLLGMSYMKYIDAGLCCFIPGKVLDEFLVILHKLESSNQPPRSHEFLQELRDISSMAMEHFDEKIAPGLKNRFPAVTLPFPIPENCDCPLVPQQGPSLSLFTFPSSQMRTPSIRTEIASLGSELRSQRANVQNVKKEVSEAKVGYTNHKKKILQQEKRIMQQGHAITELEKKVSDLNQKFVDIAAELQKLKEVKEGGESSKSISCIHTEVYPSGSNLDNKSTKLCRERLVKRQTLKRKGLDSNKSRLKRPKC